MTDPNFQAPQDPNLGQPQQPPQGQPQQPYQQQPPQQQQYQQAPVAAAPLNQADDIQWGSFAHLGGILGILPSLIIWLVFKDRGRFTNTEGKEALNFQITLVIAQIAIIILSTILAIVTFGIGSVIGLLGWVVWIVGVIFSIIGFTKAKTGQHYRYPFAIRMIK